MGLIAFSAVLTLTACSHKSTESADTFNQSTTQTIETGNIKGKKDTENNALEWLGVPYAQAERWQAPKEVDKWDDTFDATEYGEKDMGTSKNTSRASRASNLSLIYSLFLVNFCL